MATDGRRVNRPYRKASEYLANKQTTCNGPKTVAALENENAELRDKLTTSFRRLESMEVEFAQSREYFSTQLDITTDKLNRTTQALKLMQKSYSELQSVNYELEQRVLKVHELEDDRIQMTSDIHELTNKLTEARSSLQKMQHENERLRKDCNLAVSLLECNAGNFKKQPPTRQLPQDVQGRVEEYQMDISQYNEYINPYAADSDSDEDQSRQHYGMNLDTVPMQTIENTLKKPENVYANFENTDFTRDPDLNSVYKGQIKEKKLIKYDYEKSNQQAERTFPSINHESQFKVMPSRSSNSVPNSSPWELAPSSGSSSPWEMSATPSTQQENDDIADYSAASAYGAYPVSNRNPKSRKNHKNPPRSQKIVEKNSSTAPKSLYSKTKMSNSFNKATSPTMVKKTSQKGTGENNDVYISETYKQQQQQEERERITSSSGQSSRKSTPAHEKGSTAEKSSLLDLGGSDEEDMVMTIELGGKDPPKVGMGSPKREYRGQKLSSEDRGLLNESDPEPDERELDHEEVKSDMREFEEESDLREFEEESDLRESNEKGIFNKPVMPDIDLLNLDENVQVYSSNESSPVHHILMQQSYQQDLAGLLPSLPPPDIENYNNELILGDVPAPPPPDMFGEIVPPPIIDQSNTYPNNQSNQELITNQAETIFMTSQVPSTNSLDDLSEVVEKEFSKAQSTEAVSDNTSLTITQNADMDQQVFEQEFREQTSTPSGENVHSVSDANTLLTSTESQNELEKNVTPENDNKNMEEIDNLVENGGDLGENTISPPDTPENPNEKEETRYLHAVSGNNLPSTSEEKFETLEPDVAQSVDDIEAGNSPVSTPAEDETFNEPLEVVELEEEPRGANSNNRRRRNSFDHAREFGNVMVD